MSLEKGLSRANGVSVDMGLAFLWLEPYVDGPVGISKKRYLFLTVF